MLTPAEQYQYAQRNTIVRQLGFSSYKTYLLSALWKEIRHQILLPHTRCRACGNRATQVHHNRYLLKDMNGTCLDHLIPVCGRCHKKAEFNRIGSKIGPQRATKKLDQLREEQQVIWHKQDAKSAWKYFFATIEEVRIFLGMDASEDAQRLTDKLDIALRALPPKPVKAQRHKKR